MKKTLVALAALAATGAFAQSAITMYGVAEATIDLGYKNTVNTRGDTFNPAGVVTPGTAVGNSTSKAGFRVQDGNSQGVGTSRIGWRGNEDLGGGLKGNFLAEMGFRIDDGQTGGDAGNGGGSGTTGGPALLGRNAWMGVSGGFGEVRLGRQVLGAFGVQANSWAAGSSSGLYETGANTAPLMGGVRFSNAIKYLTPNLGGFTGSLTLRAPEGGGTTNSGGANPATSDIANKTGMDLSAEYSNGPLYVGFGYDKVSGTTTTNTALGLATNVLTSTSGSTKGVTLGAAYDFGIVKPYFNYSKATTNGTNSTFGPGTTFGAGPSNSDNKAFSVGLRAPFGPVTLITSYGKGKLTSNGSASNNAGLVGSAAGEVTKKAFQIGAQYALSKRTMLEANLGQLKTDGVARTTGFAANVSTGGTIANSNGKESALNFGVRHAF